MKNKTKAILCIVAAAGVVGVSGALAYLTDTDTATNKFTIGNVEIELQEPTWDEATDANTNDIPDYAENLVPNASIAKDPQVKNTGLNDAYVYLKVTVPKANIVTAQADGTLVNEGQAQATEVFLFEADAKWKEIISQRIEGTDVNTYVYYYDGVLAPNATTETIFDQVTFANVIEGQLESQNYQIDIEAYAIQADNLPDGTTIEGAYIVYANQNK